MPEYKDQFPDLDLIYLGTDKPYNSQWASERLIEADVVDRL